MRQTFLGIKPDLRSKERRISRVDPKQNREDSIFTDILHLFDQYLSPIIGPFTRLFAPDQENTNQPFKETKSMLVETMRKPRSSTVNGDFFKVVKNSNMELSKVSKNSISYREVRRDKNNVKTISSGKKEVGGACPVFIYSRHNQFSCICV